MKSQSRAMKQEKGQIFVMAALFMAIVIGFAGLAVDVGFIMRTRTTLQKNVDAMALAGAQELCLTTACESTADLKARDYGTSNGVTGADTIAIQFGTDCDGEAPASNHDLITVRVTRYQPAFLARVVGYTGGDIRACATARKFGVGGISGVRPFGLEDNCITELDYGETVVLKHDSASTRDCDALMGNFGSLAIDGTGQDLLREAIQYGSDAVICADAVPGCTNYLFSTETGEGIGPLKQGLKYVEDNTPTTCDEWSEVVTGSGAAEKINPLCNPWREGYSGPSTRLWIIPIVDGMWTSGGNNDIRVKAFAIVFWEGRSQDCAGGSNCDIEVRFVESTINLPGAEKTPLAPGATATTIALIK